MVMVKRLPKTKDSLLGGYKDNYGNWHINKYDWECLTCGKVHPQRNAAINCCKAIRKKRSEKK